MQKLLSYHYVIQTLLLCLFWFCFNGVIGQINSDKIICFGDLKNYAYTPPSGLTVSSINWDFDDGTTTSTTSPTHTYANIGKYTVRVNVNFTNSTSITDSLELEVFGLPKASFYFMAITDSCFSKNNVCILDSSLPAKSGQSLTERLIVWGDGSFRRDSQATRLDTFCHQFLVVAKYSVRLEVKDTYGCKNVFTKPIQILEDIHADFILNDTWVDCKTKRIFVVNESYGVPDSRSHYQWKLDTSAVDTGFYFTSPKNVFYKASRSGKVTLIAFANNTCRDTLIKSFSFIIDTLSNEITMSDTLMCNGSDIILDVAYPEVEMDSLCWYRDGLAPPIPPPLPIPKDFDWHYNNYRFGLGQHEIKINIFRGSCIHTVTKNYSIVGPVPAIDFIDEVQCIGKRKVFMIEKTVGVKREDCEFLWRIDDPYGDNCTFIQSKDSNLYKNCNMGKDWFIKHNFKLNVEKTYFVSLWVKDTVSGCEDSIGGLVLINKCSPILIPDTFHLCGGKLFIDDADSPIPEFFTLDSGKNWFRFPFIIDSTYIGIYDLGYIFKSLITPWAEDFGNDSIKIHKDTLFVQDTIFRGQKLAVYGPKQDSIYFKVYGHCKPFRISVFFKNGWFEPGERLRIYWGNGDVYDQTYTTRTHVDSVMKTFNVMGLSTEIQVRIENASHCYEITKFFVEKGKSFNIYTNSFINCIYDTVCLKANVYDVQKHSYWKGIDSFRKVKWIFPLENRIDTNYFACFKFKYSGMQPMFLIIKDSFGCIDTTTDTVFIQDVHANIKKTNAIIYCSELKQFFDSSYYLINPKYHPFLPFYLDGIVQYSWKFGDGIFSSLVKNPLQAFNSALDSIPAIHAIETKSGCTDSFHFYIKLIGPKPYFQIKDTIGCGSLDATFYNLSRYSKHYIWEFGDALNSNLYSSNKNPVTFKYTEPGRYFISLTGIDTVFNPFTQKMEACHVKFPDSLFQKDSIRSVLVLPLNKTAISSPDTICIGQNFQFESLSDSAYQSDYWFFGDSMNLDTTAGSRFNYTYKKAGQYLIKLNPQYIDSLQNTCKDSAQKTILVMDVKADFDIDPLPEPPDFQFYNRSSPATAGLLWNFGYSGPDNTSSEQNPYRNYGKDTGQFTVCLIAEIAFGCADTLCKIIRNDFKTDFGIYNVFTPGNKDGLNDVYDILIDGESMYDLKIYNRWGQIVYESDIDYGQGEIGNWNGKHLNTGADCPGGTYYYIFNYSHKNKPNQVETIQGVIQLIR